MTRCVVAAQMPPVMASNPCWILITRLPSTGGTSIHSPFLFSTCSPPESSCERKVNRPAESLCGPTPWDLGADGGYLTNFSRLILPLNSSKVSVGRDRHSATRCTKLCASSSMLWMYSSTRDCARGCFGYYIPSSETQWSCSELKRCTWLGPSRLCQNGSWLVHGVMPGVPKSNCF